MKIVEIKEINEELVKLLAMFRVELRKFKGINSSPNLNLAKEELNDYIISGFPIYVAYLNDRCVAYLVCRINDGIVWIESIYVNPDYRRLGIASALYKKAEELMESLGGESLYNYVHPNNDKMINFLKNNNYTVLNLIEIRKAYKGEKLDKIIKVGDHEFDY